MTEPSVKNDISERRHNSVSPEDLRLTKKEIMDCIQEVEDAFISCQKMIGVEVSNSQKGYHKLRDMMSSLRSDVVDAVNNGDSRLKQHDDEIADCLRRIEVIEKTIDQILHRVDQVEFVARATKLAVDDGNKVTHRGISSLHDTVNIALNMSVKNNSSGFTAKIPAIAWPVMGIVTIAFIAAATGHMGAFIGWLGTIKIFGGG